MKKNNALSFIIRYRWLIIAEIVSCLMTQSDTIFGVLGTIMYGPALFFGAVMSALLARHWFFRNTLDEDAHSRHFVTFWRCMNHRDRVLANLGVVSVFVLAAAIIFSALVK